MTAPPKTPPKSGRSNDLAAAACVLVTLAGVLLVFGPGWALIVAGLLSLAVIIGLRLLELRDE